MREIKVTEQIRALHFKYTGMYVDDKTIARWYKNYIHPDTKNRGDSK